MSRGKTLPKLLLTALLASLAAVWMVRADHGDDQWTAKRRVFSSLGPGLRALRRGPGGRYCALVSSSDGILVFDAQGKALSVLAAGSGAAASNPASRSGFAGGEDLDVDSQGNFYVADRSTNLVKVFSSDGKLLRSFPVHAPMSLAALPDSEVAVTGPEQTHLVVVYGANGKVAREFGELESFSTRPELDRYLNSGRLASDPQGHLYYGYTYLPEPLVRQFDRYGYAGTEFQFTGLDAFPEAQATRKAIEREEKRSDPPILRAILTAFGADPVKGDVWMGLHNTLIHFDPEGNRLSDYQIYTTSGARLDATILLVEEDRLLIGSDPLGVYEFLRPGGKL